MDEEDGGHPLAHLIEGPMVEGGQLQNGHLLGPVEAVDLLPPVALGVELNLGRGTAVEAKPPGDDLFHNRLSCQDLHAAAPFSEDTTLI